MKKKLVLLLAVIMLLCMVSACGAKTDQAPAPTTTQTAPTDPDEEKLLWEDYLPELESAYQSGEFQGNIQFQTLKNYGLKFWLPGDMIPDEMTAEQLEKGIIGFYSSNERPEWLRIETGELDDGMDYEELLALYLANDALNEITPPQRVTVNGMNAIWCSERAEYEDGPVTLEELVLIVNKNTVVVFAMPWKNNGALSWGVFNSVQPA